MIGIHFANKWKSHRFEKIINGISGIVSRIINNINFP